MTCTEGYYATLVHEPVHWTGAKHRLDRDVGKRFGDHAYAAEELIAELGAAFLCAELSITQDVRADHAQYLANWLTLLKEDDRAFSPLPRALRKPCRSSGSTRRPEHDSGSYFVLCPKDVKR